MTLFGYDDEPLIATNLKVQEKAISIGEDIHFSFDISTDKDTKVRLDFKLKKG